MRKLFKYSALGSFFLLPSFLVCAMDNEEGQTQQVLRNRPAPQAESFGGLPAEIIQSKIFPCLNVLDFYAFGGTCQLIYNLTRDPHLYLSSDFPTLIQQLKKFILPNQKVDLETLFPYAQRTQNADYLLFGAGMSYFSLNISPGGVKINLDAQWKPYGWALYLAESMGNYEAIKQRHTIIKENKSLIETQEQPWVYSFPVSPTTCFKESEADSYRVVCDFMIFGRKWNYTLEKRYKDVSSIMLDFSFLGTNFSWMNSGKMSKLTQMWVNLSNILKIDLENQQKDPHKKMSFLFGDTHIRMKEIHLQGLFSFWKKKKASIAALISTGGAEKEVMALQKEEKILRSELINLYITTPQRIPIEDEQKASYELKAASIFEEIEHESLAGPLYVKAVKFLTHHTDPSDPETKDIENNKEAILAGSLKAIAIFEEEGGDKKEMAKIYEWAAKFSKNASDKCSFYVKAAALYRENGSRERAEACEKEAQKLIQKEPY